MSKIDTTVVVPRISEELNIGARHISLSTCGIVDKIYDLMEKNLQITLSISLHAPNHQIREQVMPIEKKYNIKLTLTDESGLPTISERIKTEALAGTDYCDLIILQDKSFQALAASDLLINVRSVPYLNLNASYYFQNALESTTLGNYSYGFSGDFIYKPENCYGVFFNRKLLSKTQLPDIYQLVRENQWDMENFLIFAEEVYSIVRSEGQKMSGVTSEDSTEDLVNVFWAATGFQFLANEYGSRTELVFDHEYTQNFITSAKNIFFKSSSSFFIISKQPHPFGCGRVLYCRLTSSDPRGSCCKRTRSPWRGSRSPRRTHGPWSW